MTAAAPLAFPGGPALATWWRQLAPHRPRQLWAGHLLLHGVEALVATRHPARLTPFDGLVLQALALPHARPTPDGTTLAEAEAALHLGRQALRQVLRRLQSEGLAREEPAAGAWALTAAGRRALAGEVSWRSAEERRVFYFVEGGQPGRPPEYLSLRDAPLHPWPGPQAQAFDAGWLRACVARPPEWKRARGFPEDVQEVLPPPNGEGDPAAWQRVILDRPARLAAALVRAGDGGDRLLGFPTRPEAGALLSTEPVFTLGGDWPEVFPALAEEVPAEAWRPAWREWCRSQNLTPSDAAACALERAGYRLRVLAPGRLVARLRSMRSEALAGEAWLLAGDGLLRPAAQVEVVEKEAGAR